MQAQQLFGVVLIVLAALVLTDARPAMDDVANMAEALRYLEQIDKYYSQMARPRACFCARSEEHARLEVHALSGTIRFGRSVNRKIATSKDSGEGGLTAEDK